MRRHFSDTSFARGNSWIGNIRNHSGFQTFVNDRSVALSPAHQKQGPFPPPELPGFPGRMTLSDFRTGHPPIENVGGATPTSAGYPPITQTTFLTCRAHYPGGSYRCVSVFFPVRAAFPSYLVGRHPRRHFRGLLKLHSRYGLQDCSPAYGGLLSRGSSPASYPTKPLGSYHVLPTSTWVNPPFTGDLRRWGAQVVSRCAVIQELIPF